MPPKAKSKGSNALVARGKREIIHASSARKSLGQKPSTSRALILRNAKFGAVGSGEVQLFNKRIFGQEKLDLLAEDLIANAVRAPFDFEKLKRSVEAEYEAYASQIENLRDPEFSWCDLVAELIARSSGDADQNRTADLVGSKVHNLYVLTSSWRLATLIMEHLAKLGISDSNIKTAIEKDKGVASLMQNLYEVLQNVLVLQLSMMRTYSRASKHYSPYFKTSTNGTIEFDNTKLKELYKSYIDSIILEFILPSSRYPIHVLVALLHNCLEEAPKEADRITQAMYDAMGDLCVTVQCLDMVENPLINLPAVEVQASPLMERFRQAQRLSTEAASVANTNKYRDVVHPLPKLKQKAGLDALWAKIDQNYKAVTGVTIDELFELGKERVPRGQWSFTGTAPPKKVSDEPKKLLSNKAHQRNDDSDSDLPDLVTDSDSDDYVENDEYSDSDSDGEYDHDSALDTDDEDNMRELLRECMDAASANPELLNQTTDVPAQHKSNGLLKALKNLAGRVFSGDPVLTVDNKPRSKFFGPEKPPTSAVPPTKQPPSGASTTRRTAPQGPGGMKATVEEVPDEEAGGTQKKKKKKKPKKKKKKTATANAEADDDDDEDDEGAKQVEDQQMEKALADLSLDAKGSADQDAKSLAKPKPKPSTSSSSIYGMGGASLPSSVSLVSTTAQSARSYLKAENLLDEKTKIKSRPDPGTVPQSPSKVLGGKSKDKKNKGDRTDAKEGVFSRLLAGAKFSTQTCLHKMFGGQKGSMKWDDFVKSMVDLGFTYEGSTAGSSVRFDPPDPKDPSITVHKPHPKAILGHVQIKNIAKRLKGRYDWKPELFMSTDL